jgi:AbrB family looped-hinge helix DNA binding protein
MEVIKISSNFQVVIPRKTREQFNIKPDQKVVFISYKKSLRTVILPIIDEACGMLQELDAENLRKEEDEKYLMRADFEPHQAIGRNRRKPS